MINHLMYGDDLVILSPSAKGLQRLVDMVLSSVSTTHLKKVENTVANTSILSSQLRKHWRTVLYILLVAGVSHSG